MRHAAKEVSLGLLSRSAIIQGLAFNPQTINKGFYFLASPYLRRQSFEAVQRKSLLAAWLVLYYRAAKSRNGQAKQKAHSIEPQSYKLQLQDKAISQQVGQLYHPCSSKGNHMGVRQV